MLSSYLSVEVFLKGVSGYLKAHAYGNATTKDLWAALEKASGQNVNEFMNPWIKEVGFPVVTIAEEPQQISLRQNRFLLTGDVKDEEDKTIWWIPLGLSQSQTLNTVAHTQLTTKEDTLRGIENDFYKFNTGHTGFYRTNYPPGQLLRLGSIHAKLSAEDNIGLIGDSSALAIAGQGTTASVLALLENFEDEKNHL